MNHEPQFTDETNFRIQRFMEIILSERFGDLDQDYDACAGLLEISQEEDYKYGIAFAYAYLGDCFIGKNESAHASPNLMRAKELCEEYQFWDLLPYVYTWLGIYYEMQSDRLMAVHYFLDALDFAERNQDVLRQSILINNIASQFQSCGNYELAKEYYINSFLLNNSLEGSSSSDPHYARMTANLVSVCCKLNQIDEARYYFSLLKNSEFRESTQSQLFLCELLISAAVEDVEAMRKNVDKLLLELEKHAKDAHQFFETFLVVADSIIVLKEEEYARKVLATLNNMCEEEDYSHRLKVQCLWMQFYKCFGTQEERNAACELFYELRQLSDSILNRNLANGLLSEIKLRDSLKKNQEIEKANEQLEGEVQFDELTQLYNRRSFRKLTEQAAADPQIYALSFIMIDVDYFKQYNDTYGHAKGDEVLRAVAACMLEASDRNTSCFRYGGDEFVCMCKNKTEEEVESFVHSLSETLRKKQIPHEASLCSKEVTLSIGFSVRTKQEGGLIDASEVMTEADAALYKAKAEGRNGHCLYSSGGEKN